MTNFASRLGVDQAKLNSAFNDAVNSTVDQAVTDGIMTQDQANSAKNMVQKGGFRGVIASGFSPAQASRTVFRAMPTPTPRPPSY